MQVDVVRILHTISAIILFRLVSCARTMECFHCPSTSTNNEECKQSGYTQQCTVGYNTCFTQIKYKGGSNFTPKTVTRSCVDDTFCSEEKQTYNNGKCIKSEQDYICVWCCQENNCNMLSSAHKSTIRPVLLLGSITAAAFLSGEIMWHW